MKNSSSTTSTAINSSNASNENVRNDGLTPSQERAIETLLTARSVAAAARDADVGESTLRRWLREDKNFQRKLRGLREEALSHGALQLQNGVSKAVGKLYDLIDSNKGIEPGRASLVRTALEYAYRSNVYSDVLERMKTLEADQIEAAKS